MKKAAIGKGIIAYLLTGSFGLAILVYLLFLAMGR
jgi:uncharacterized membrane protein